MTRTTLVVALALFAAAGRPGLADSPPLLESFEFYGSLRGHIAAFDGETEVQDNSSRAGLRFQRAFHAGPTVLAGFEASVNLFDSDTQFRLEGSTSTGFVTIQPQSRGTMFGTRLGFLGLDFGRGGSVTIGKQWSVYYDIAGLTDRFDVFGGEGGQTFVGGTDGGGAGTGRVERALIYRNKIGQLDLGLQGQMRGGKANVLDGYGISLRHPLGEGFLVGAAFVQARLEEANLPFIPGLHGNPRYVSLGAQMERGPWLVALVLSKQKNGDFATVVDPATTEPESVVFDANGVEFHTRWQAQPHLRFKFGGGYVDPVDLTSPIDADFALKYLIVGAEWFFDESTYIYCEGRLDQSVTPDGASRPDVLLIGLRFDFSLRKTTGSRP